MRTSFSGAAGQACGTPLACELLFRAPGYLGLLLDQPRSAGPAVGPARPAGRGPGMDQGTAHLSPARPSPALTPAARSSRSSDEHGRGSIPPVRHRPSSPARPMIVVHRERIAHTKHHDHGAILPPSPEISRRSEWGERARHREERPRHRACVPQARSNWTCVPQARWTPPRSRRHRRDMS